MELVLSFQNLYKSNLVPILYPITYPIQIQQSIIVCNGLYNKLQNPDLDGDRRRLFSLH